MSDADILAGAHMAHLAAVQAVLGPNMALGESTPQRVRGPRRRAAEPDRKLKQLQRRLRMLAQAADFAGQTDLAEFAEETLKETEEKSEAV